jgi:hypothetical protein
MEINTGVERMIAVFEDGWASGAMHGPETPPTDIDAALVEYWRDGFFAGVEDSRMAAALSATVH